MQHILEYNSFFKIGDKVIIEYWYNGMITPVKILEGITSRTYKISHDIEESKISNAPDEIIKSTDIIDLLK